MDHEPLIILAFSFHPLLSLSAVCRMQRQTFLKKELMLRKLSVKNDILNLSGIYFIFPLSYLARNPINFFIFYYLIFFFEALPNDEYLFCTFVEIPRQRKLKLTKKKSRHWAVDDNNDDDDDEFGYWWKKEDIGMSL